MQPYDYEAVIWDSEVYCIECLPDTVKVTHEDVSPIFAESEWDSYPTCCWCHTVHDYVNLL